MTAETRRRLAGIRALTGTPPALNLDGLPPDPVALFWSWLAEAVDAGVAEARTVALATADEHGVPDVRMLILKDVDDRGWAFASTASSRKGRHLAANPAAAMNFWWQPLARAVRVRGQVKEAPLGESAADLAARSPEAQASVSEGDWRLWRLVPGRVEFWQGSPDRRHLRIVYTPADAGWVHTVGHADGS